MKIATILMGEIFFKWLLPLHRYHQVHISPLSSVFSLPFPVFNHFLSLLVYTFCISLHKWADALLFPYIPFVFTRKVASIDALTICLLHLTNFPGDRSNSDFTKTLLILFHSCASYSVVLLRHEISVSAFLCLSNSCFQCFATQLFLHLLLTVYLYCSSLWCYI